MKKILLGLMFCTNAWAETAWTAAQAKNQAENAVGTIIEAQKLLKYAIQAKDKAGWESWVRRDFDSLLNKFQTQRLSLKNKNLTRYDDCESALLEYRYYSETFFRPDTMLNLQSRDVNHEDFKKYFESCKKSVG